MTAAATPARLTRRSARPSRRVGPGLCAPIVAALRAASRSGSSGSATATVVRTSGVDAEQHDEVQREESERPAGARPRVEVDGERGEHSERDPGCAERQAAAPVQAQPLPGVGELEVARAHERHRAVGERRDQRAGEHGEHEQRVHRDARRSTANDEHRSHRGVDGHEPPRVPVQVARTASLRARACAHPFTPDETTPETK